MKKISSILGALIFWGANLSSAEESRWLEVAQGESTVVSVDSKSIRRNGEKVKAWVRYIYQNPVAAANFPQKSYMSSKALNVYNCVNHTVAALQAIRYADQYSNDVVESFNWPESTTGYTEIVPETLGEGIMEFVCSYTEKRKKN
jgi:hypothetical protein